MRGTIMWSLCPCLDVGEFGSRCTEHRHAKTKRDFLRQDRCKEEACKREYYYFACEVIIVFGERTTKKDRERQKERDSIIQHHYFPFVMHAVRTSSSLRRSSHTSSILLASTARATPCSADLYKATSHAQQVSQRHTVPE